MRLAIIILALMLFALPANAYTPNTGDRAAPIIGRDVISGDVVSLEDYLGKWVFVDFWASWCGPCMHELPNLLESSAPYRKSGDLALFTVSLDSWETVDRMKEVIREHRIKYPVVFDGGGWSTVQSKEWGINSIPATFLIDPQGNIVAKGLRGEALAPALDFFINHDGVYAPIGVRSSDVLNDDGSVTVRLELSNPRHTPLTVEVDYWHTRLIWADDDPDHEERPVDAEYIEVNEEDPEMSFEVEFGMFGEKVHEFTIGAEDAHHLAYYVMVELPGTEDLVDGDGIWVASSGRVNLEPEE